jgi:predicted nucleic acid-binding protein
MTRLLVDTSVLIKWFHSEGESELPAARALLSGHLAGDVSAHLLDLALYEVGNVLVRTLTWPPEAVADQLDDLVTICGTPLVMHQDWLRDAAELADRHTLTFYDACWASAARGVGIPLVSADQRLLAAGLAESATAAVERLRLRDASIWGGDTRPVRTIRAL